MPILTALAVTWNANGDALTSLAELLYQRHYDADAAPSHPALRDRPSSPGRRRRLRRARSRRRSRVLSVARGIVPASRLGSR